MPGEIQKNERSSVMFLMYLRAALAVLALSTPHLSARLLGIDPARQSAVPYLLRLFGGRNALLALALKRIEMNRNPRVFLAANVLLDIADTGAAVVAHRGGELSPRTTSLVAGTASIATCLGLMSLWTWDGAVSADFRTSSSSAANSI